MTASAPRPHQSVEATGQPQFLVILMHYLVVMALAPATGITASTVFGAFDHGRFHPELAISTAIASPLALFFILPWLMLLGIVTFLFCGIAVRHSWDVLWHWVVLSALLGLACGFGMGRWSSAIVHITTPIGLVVGTFSGFALHKIWNRETPHFSPLNT